MADEISVNVTLTCTNGEFSSFAKSYSFTADQATAGGGQPGTVPVTTTDAAIAINNLTTPRWAMIKNIGANPVDIGPTSGGAIVKLARVLPGEAFPVPLAPSVALRAQATTGTSTLEISALEA